MIIFVNGLIPQHLSFFRSVCPREIISIIDRPEYSVIQIKQSDGRQCPRLGVEFCTTFRVHHGHDHLLRLAGKFRILKHHDKDYDHQNGRHHAVRHLIEREHRFQKIKKKSDNTRGFLSNSPTLWPPSTSTGQSKVVGVLAGVLRIFFLLFSVCYPHRSRSKPAASQKKRQVFCAKTPSSNNMPFSWEVGRRTCGSGHRLLYVRGVDFW